MAHKFTDINLRRLFTNIHAHHDNPGSRVVSSLDIEMAFDTVEWPFLWETLRRMGFPMFFFIGYKSTNLPTAAIRLGGLLSPSFWLFRVVPDRTALSFQLFLPLPWNLWQKHSVSPLIKGLWLHPAEPYASFTTGQDQTESMGEPSPVPPRTI